MPLQLKNDIIFDLKKFSVCLFYTLLVVLVLVYLTHLGWVEYFPLPCVILLFLLLGYPNSYFFFFQYFERVYNYFDCNNFGQFIINMMIFV